MSGCPFHFLLPSDDRVWEDGKYLGHLSAGTDRTLSPHGGAVNTLALDDRTRYLLSGDSNGSILVWRTGAVKCVLAASVLFFRPLLPCTRPSQTPPLTRDCYIALPRSHRRLRLVSIAPSVQAR